jgi:endonuclease I
VVFALGGLATGRAEYDPPAGYYSTAAVLSGTALKAALNVRIRGHTVIPYTASTTDVWNALDVLDADPGNASNLLLLYSGESRPKTLKDNGTNTSNWWNREHVWPLARGPGSTGTVPGTDLFHLYACDKDVNANRGDDAYDEVTFTPDPEAPLSGSNGTWWNPRDADKGRIARSLFYMAVRYEAADSVNLELAETAGATTMGKLSTLLVWHRRFPPTAAERARNHRIYTDYQGNRNPFIDNPLYAEGVFSGDAPFTAWRRARFNATELANAAVAGPAADPDGDGLPNRLEFLFNLDPRVADATATNRPAVAWLAPSTLGGAARLALTYRRHRYASDLTVRHESSGDLATWTEFTPSATSVVYVDAATDAVTVEMATSGARTFVRLRVE